MGGNVFDGVLREGAFGGFTIVVFYFGRSVDSGFMVEGYFIESN